MTDNTPPSREELLQRLRKKTSSKNRAGPSKQKKIDAPQVNKNVDMASLMMSMGLDDPDLIKEIGNTNNPKAILSKLNNIMDKAKKDEETKKYEETCAPAHIVPPVSDDEEVPELIKY